MRQVVHRRTPVVQEELQVLQEHLCMLVLGSVTRIGVQDQLSVRQVLHEDESVES